VALSANSPFWRGFDTRLASTRIKIFEMFPRSGLPPTFRNWEDFEDHIEALVASGSIPDYSWCWWDARPHQKFGTVELRAPDVQTDASYTVALAALVQCLVARAGMDEQPPEDALYNAENKWRAVRYGMDADFYDFVAGRAIPARSLARGLIEELRPVARDLGCEEELGGLLEIVELGTGAELQRAAHKRSGSLEGMMDYLIAGTAPG
jgi:carboxylate-amine ligase